MVLLLECEQADDFIPALEIGYRLIFKLLL